MTTTVADQLPARLREWDVHPLDTDTVHGTTSTVIWSLVLVATVLYVGPLLGTGNEARS